MHSKLDLIIQEPPKAQQVWTQKKTQRQHSLPSKTESTILPRRRLVKTQSSRAPSQSPFYFLLAAIGVWTAYMAWTSQFHLFLTNWFMSLTMGFGSFVAGSTSVGGGAVAFPVMHLIFNISAESARNFSLAIQSVGMTAAAFAIWRCRFPVERHALIFASLGGAFGVVFGTFFVVPLLTNAAYTKMFFAAFWLSFAVTLFMINSRRDRKVHDEIVNFVPHRTGMVLLTAGVLGGVVTSLTGSGLDIVVFSFLCLRYRICEKVATPTSVVLMAFNSVIGFLTHLFLVSTPVSDVLYWLGDFEMQTRDYWLVSIPVVLIGAPAGVRFIRNKTRLFVADLLYICIVVQFVGTLLVLRPQGLLAAFTVSVLLAGISLFVALAFTGRRRSHEHPQL